MNGTWSITYYQNEKVHQKHENFTAASDHGQEMYSINLHPQITYQTMEGFGGAFTEAAAFTYHRMSEQTKKEFQEAYFSENGLGYTQARMSLDSCDACLSNYEAMPDPEDQQMVSFSLQRDEQYILPFYQELNRYCLKQNKAPIEVFLSPWSPPAFMKSNGEKNHGGKLKKEYYTLWAEYFCRFISEYKKRGVSIRRISLQNEPNAVQKWDSCCYTGEEEKEFLQHYLYPAMKQHNLTHLEIYIWDHNKERALERAQQIIEEETQEMITGVAFHWYSGDHFEALSMLKEQYPKIKLAFTEGCVEYSRYQNTSQVEHALMYAHDIAGDLGHGASLFLDWCILLDHEGGPNHVRNFVEAPIMYEEHQDMLRYNLSYYYISHYSRYILPGSVRIGMSRYTDELDVVAFLRPDQKIVVTILNRTRKEQHFFIRMDGKLITLWLPEYGIGTAMIEMEE